MIRLKCINSQFAGKHLQGVPFERKVLHIHGVEAEGVFPVFQGIKVELLADVDTMYHQLGNTDQAFYSGTMREAAKILKEMLRRTPSLSTQFSAQQLSDIEQEKGQISGKVWHHYEELTPDGRPIMQLVDREAHQKCKHTGGSYTWNPKHFHIPPIL